MNHIPQRKEYDCTVACIAMVLDKPYEEVSKYFCADFDKEGLEIELVKHTVCEHGFAVIEKTCDNYLDITRMNERMKIPFADVHIVNTWRYADSRVCHAVVMDVDGKLYDPAGSSGNYYFIERVLGFYKEK